MRFPAAIRPWALDPGMLRLSRRDADTDFGGIPLDNAIETHGLTKYYGKNRGVVGLDLEVREGEVFGFLGPNGAGKTTTIRLLLNLLQPTSGGATVLGMDVATQSLAVRRACGVVSSDSAFYESLSGRAHLALMQSHHNGGQHRGDEVAERLGLDLDRPVKQYSHGTRQKLAIVQALAHSPKLLVLDEPTAGLDPLVQQEFFRLLLEERDRGVTVFFSSHVLSEVDRLCDRVGIIRDGVLAATLDVDELHRRQVRRMEVTLSRDATPEDFAMEDVTVISCEGYRAELQVAGHVGALIGRLAALPVENIVFPEASMEDTFTRFYAGDGGEA